MVFQFKIQIEGITKPLYMEKGLLIGKVPLMGSSIYPTKATIIPEINNRIDNFYYFCVNNLY